MLRNFAENTPRPVEAHEAVLSEALDNLRDALELHFTPPVATVVPHVRNIEIDIKAA